MDRMLRRRLAAVVATVLCWGSWAPAAFGCHLPEHLRMTEPNLSAAQLSLLAHGGSVMNTIPYSLFASESCIGGMADIFPCQRVDLLAHVPLADIGGGSGNDLWGWKDPLTGIEYALVGRSSGVSFIDLSDPVNPVYVGRLPTRSQTSSWRDIKVYRDHAFIVADFAGSHGMQVFDLTRLRGASGPPVVYSEDAHYAGFNRAHNVVINEETGYAYAVGGETCSGGLHMMDLSDPKTPSFVGCFSADGYTHDAQCVSYEGPDPDYQGREICFASNEDTVTVIDVTDKMNPVQVSRTGYPETGYTHQGWLTEDHAYFVHDDELDERNFGANTRTFLWDMRDLDNPSIQQTYESDGQSIDHNQYVKEGFTYQANYRRGLRILSVDPGKAGLTEVAYFDTYPDGDGNQFNGAWSTYPYFDNGVVLVSDINRGLFVLRANLPLGPMDIFRDGFETGNTEGWAATGTALLGVAMALFGDA